MSERVLAVAEELCREIESFDPALYSGADRARWRRPWPGPRKPVAGPAGRRPGRGPAGRTRTGALPTGPTGWPRARAAPGAKPGRAGHGQVFRRPAGHGRGAGQRPGAPERGGRGGPGRGRTPGQRKRTGGPGPGPGSAPAHPGERLRHAARCPCARRRVLPVGAGLAWGRRRLDSTSYFCNGFHYVDGLNQESSRRRVKEAGPWQSKGPPLVSRSLTRGPWARCPWSSAYAAAD